MEWGEKMFTELLHHLTSFYFQIHAFLYLSLFSSHSFLSCNYYFLGMFLRNLAVSWIVWSIIWRQYCGARLETGVDHYCMSYTAISVSPHRRVFAMRVNCAPTGVDHYCLSYTAVSASPHRRVFVGHTIKLAYFTC